MKAPISITPFELATRFIGLAEVSGHASNPQILAMLQLDNKWPAGDEVAWCSAFTSYIAWLLDLPRSKSLAARTWLHVGERISLDDAAPGFDVVILKRGGANQPDASIVAAPGHVGFFAGIDGYRVRVLGGNQQDSVCVESFPIANVLGVVRL